MLFNEQVPQSQFDIDPTYLPDNKKWIASLLGFKNTGERNTWGKIQRFLGPTAMETNLLARGLGAPGSDFRDHVKENMEGDVAGFKTTLGAATAVAGGITGNPQLVAAGAKTVMSQLPGALKNDVSLDGDWGTKYYMKGGNITMANGETPWWDGAEDIAMIDKKTGKHVGNVSYDESINDKGATKKMKALAAKKDYEGLGKFMAEEMKTWTDGGDKKKGGNLTKDVAATILKEGKVYGKPISDRQKMFFKYVADGGDTNDYVHGGEVKNYDSSDLITTPTSWMQSSPEDRPASMFDQLGGAEQLFNIGQFATGMFGANDKLPEYKKPEAWTKYLMDLHQKSLYGMSGAERGELQRGNDRALTTGLNAARELSGGNSSFAVGQASKFAGDYMSHAMDFAVENEKLKRVSMLDYGNALTQDIAYDKEAFNQKYNEAMLKKTNAADLARTGLQSFIDQGDYEKNYGKNSMHQEYMRSLINLNKKLSGMGDDWWIEKTFGKGDTPTVPTGAVAPPNAPMNGFPPANQWWMGNNTVDPLTGEPIY